MVALKAISWRRHFVTSLQVQHASKWSMKSQATAVILQIRGDPVSTTRIHLRPTPTVLRDLFGRLDSLHGQGTLWDAPDWRTFLHRKLLGLDRDSQKLRQVVTVVR
ncbi:hypothetical protein Ct61P_10153 [Colletotrichum tofieldiae]|nr:hypothetical protein Ct61P_10153 [Colletotrichum tofieldiae]